MFLFFRHLFNVSFLSSHLFPLQHARPYLAFAADFAE
jgi:hypothetical protein